MTEDAVRLPPMSVAPRLLTYLCYLAMMSLSIGLNLLPVFLTTLSATYGGVDGLTGEQLGRLGAISFAGLVLGILITGPLADRLGAKPFAQLGNALIGISLVAAAFAPGYAWLGVALVYYFLRREMRGAWVIGLAVLSHWVLDLVVHVPDLPLYPGDSPLLGFGLWQSVVWTQVVEFALLGLGVWLYTRVTKATNGKGRWGFAGLIAFLVIIQVGNVFGPPPPSVTAIAWVGQAQWLLVLWAYWVDRHRIVR